jgi:uncharacterized protein YkwD
METLIALFLSLFSFLTKPISLINPFIGTPTAIPTASPELVEGPTPTTKPTLKPKPTLSQSALQTPRPTAVGDTAPWGVSRQTGPDTWTMKIAPDSKMGTPREILVALNDYRVRFGSQPLTWNDNLTGFAQSRADYIASKKNTDGHAGFIDYLDNQDGYNRLGFTWLGENISYGFKLEAVHLIEWMYAGDKPHNDNQLNNRWNYVGIGVNGTATSIIFGTGKR